MTIEKIKERIEEIRAYANEYEGEEAHLKEDSLRERFIKHVMMNPTDPELEEKARLVASTTEINFARWCA